MSHDGDPRRSAPARAQAAASSSQRAFSVGIADPVPLFRDGVAALVDKTPWLTLAAHSVSQQGTLHMVQQTEPDTVLVDSALDPRCHLGQILVSANPTMRVILLIRDAHRNPAYLANAMSTGVHGAVPRSAEPQRVLDTLRHTRKVRRYLDPALAELLAQTPSQDGGQPTGNGEVTGSGTSLARLSRREHQVLQLVAEGLENAAIAHVLVLSVETVRTHVKSILRKFSARDRTHAVTLAFRSGLLTLTHSEGTTPQPAEQARPHKTADTSSARTTLRRA